MYTCILLYLYTAVYHCIPCILSEPLCRRVRLMYTHVYLNTVYSRVYTSDPFRHTFCGGEGHLLHRVCHSTASGPSTIHLQPLRSLPVFLCALLTYRVTHFSPPINESGIQQSLQVYMVYMCIQQPLPSTGWFRRYTCTGYTVVYSGIYRYTAVLPPGS